MLSLLNKYYDFIIGSPVKAFWVTLLVTLATFAGSLVLTSHGSAWSIALWPIWMGGTIYSVVILHEILRHRQ
mgnify:FL=1